MQQVKYAGLTDGNRWVLDDVSDFSGERRKLDVTIANMPAHQCALNLLLLWQLKISAQQMVNRIPTVEYTGISSLPLSGEVVSIEQESAIPDVVSRNNGQWISLAEINQNAKGGFPKAVRMPDGAEITIDVQHEVLTAAAEYLIRRGKLTVDDCPVKWARTDNIVHSQPRFSDGKPFEGPKTLTNGLYLESRTKRPLIKARTLLERFGEDPSACSVRL